jgi:Kef-type K+ transport system membrane component KefB/nucleotide-binding universal stress UspA family protein
MHFDPIVLVLIDVLLVIGLSRFAGLIFSQIKQPLVIGEIVAGVMLGPSLLGLLFPTAAAFLFPPEVIPLLGILSQVGLIFFMFLIGLELDPSYLRGSLNTAILVSHVSILVPFSLGTVLSLLLFPLVSNAGVSFTAFALFLGAAMSITAFPVLARIITENNLQNSRLGTLALTCAAVDDVTAWCLLLVAIAVTRTNTMVGAMPNILASVLYIAFMLTIGRRLLRKFGPIYDGAGKLTQSMLAAIYSLVIVSALITEMIGIHLIFGAFLLGAVMPKHEGLVRELAAKTEDFVLTFLLPIFFAYSGLRTQVGLLNSLPLWGLCGLVLLVAIAGKYVGTYLAARVSGLSKRDSSALGWLMNTRGLTELIVLNIGLNLGVITPLLFTMLVIMALVTTFMTSPLLEWTYPKQLMREQMMPTQEADRPSSTDYSILVPIANPKSQQGLMQMAIEIARSASHNAVVNPLSLIQFEQDYSFENLPQEADRRIRRREEKLSASLERFSAEAQPLIQPIVQLSGDVARTTHDIAIAQNTDLIVVGWHRPAFSNNRLGGRVGQILSTAPVDVAVFVDAGKALGLVSEPLGDMPYDHLLLPYSPNIHTELGLELCLRLLLNAPDRKLTILRVHQPNHPVEFSYEFHKLMERLPETLHDRISTPNLETLFPIEAVIDASAQVDLTIAGTSREWGIERQTLGNYTDALAARCRSSLLITRRFSQVTSQHLDRVLRIS